MDPPVELQTEKVWELSSEKDKCTCRKKSRDLVESSTQAIAVVQNIRTSSDKDLTVTRENCTATEIEATIFCAQTKTEQSVGGSLLPNITVEKQSKNGESVETSNANALSEDELIEDFAH